jgi:hypothetical protein
MHNKTGLLLQIKNYSKTLNTTNTFTKYHLSLVKQENWHQMNMPIQNFGLSE